MKEIKTALSARSGPAILKNPMDPFYSLVKEFQDVVCTNPPSVLPPDRGVRHEIDLVPTPNIVSPDSGHCHRNSVTSLTTSFVLSTRQEWYEKVNLPIQHRHFVSKSQVVNGASSTLIISSTLPLYQHKPPFLERMFFRTIWRVAQYIVPLT